LKKKKENTSGNLRKEILTYKWHYEELKQILDASFDQITISDGNGVFLMASKNSITTFGIDEKDFVGMTARELEDQGILKPSVTLMVLKSKKKRDHYPGHRFREAGDGDRHPDV